MFSRGDIQLLLIFTIINMEKDTKTKTNTLADKVNMYHRLILNAQKNGAIRLASLYQSALKNILTNKKNGK